MKVKRVSHWLWIQFLIVSVIYGAVAITSYEQFQHVKVQGELYRRLKDIGELEADVNPPAMAVTEAYLIGHIVEDERDPVRIRELIARLRQLSDHFEERRAHWETTTLSPELKQLLTAAGSERADEFYQMIRSRLIPALEERRFEDVFKLTGGPMLRAYNDQKGALASLTRAAETESARVQAEAAAAVGEASRNLAVLGFVNIGIMALVAWQVNTRVRSRLGAAADQINQATVEFAAAIEEQERMSSQQAAAVGETTTTMSELGASCRVAADQASSAARVTESALSVSDEGADAVGKTLTGMQHLKQRSEAIAQQVLRLSEHTGQIGSITGLVGDLANQTNLLALNAAVEAARAGEYGRGFGVVATEIRKLADESKRSAERIASLVAEIQQATNSVVMAAEQGSKNVDESARLATQSGDSFHRLTDSIGSASESVQQIAMNSQQQAAAVRQVVEAMTSLDAGARDAAAAVRNSRSGVERLKRASQQLAELI